MTSPRQKEWEFSERSERTERSERQIEYALSLKGSSPPADSDFNMVLDVTTAVNYFGSTHFENVNKTLEFF